MYKTINQAVKVNSLKYVKQLTNVKKIHKGDFKNSILSACKLGYIDIADYLFKLNDNKNIIEKNKYEEAIWLALTNRKHDMIKYLLTNNRYTERYISSLVSHSCEHGLLESLKTIIKEKKIDSKLININFPKAAERGKIKIIKFLLKLYKIEKKYIDMAIINACFNGKSQTVSFLLKEYKYTEKLYKTFFKNAYISNNIKTINLVLNENSLKLDSETISIIFHTPNKWRPEGFVKDNIELFINHYYNHPKIKKYIDIQEIERKLKKSYADEEWLEVPLLKLKEKVLINKLKDF